MTKKKLCWNCEGRVSNQEENCPFCGVYINGTLHMQGGGHEDEDSDLSDETKAHAPLYTPMPEAANKIPAEQVTQISQKANLTAKPSYFGKEFLPLLLLITGTVFLFFSLVLVLFSHEGVFTLQWDATLWYVYLIISLPALLVGWRLLQDDSYNGKL